MSKDARPGAYIGSGKLFSVWQITIAAAIGAPIAAAFLLARNYRELGRGESARHSLGWGVTSTVLLLLITLLLPRNFPRVALPVGYCFAIKQLSARLQGAAISDHLKAGGSKGSWAAVLGIGLGCLVLIFGSILGVLFALEMSGVLPD